MADLRVSDLPVLTGTDLAATDVLPIADLSASETKKLTSKELIQNGVTLIDDGTIPGAKLVADSVTAAEIAPDSITSSELANGAVDTASIQNDAVTDIKIANGIDGAKLLDNTVTAAKVTAGSLDRGLDKTSGAIGHTNSIAPAVHNGISFDAEGHVDGTAPLQSSDLPIATTNLVGGVSVPVNSDLTVSGAGALGHASSIVGGTTNGITYNNSGHITAAAPLGAADLPAATTTAKGAVSVPGPALTVSPSGALTHEPSGVLAGTHQSVTVDVRGHVTAGGPLTAGMVPNLDASKITTGEFPTARLADQSVTSAKLADYAISFIQEATPSLAGVPIGTLWLQESTGQLRCNNGNSWFAVGFGRLSSENLRFCGNFDATTGLITGITEFGTQAGYSVGDPIAAASDVQTGIYFVCDTPGSGTAVMPGTTFDAGDWILCLGASGGWSRIDTLSGGGGGGGAAYLDDLLDVTIINPVEDQFLRYGSAGQWENVNVISGGTY